MNMSIGVYIDEKSPEFFLKNISKMFSGEVIINGSKWTDTLNKRPVILITLLNCEVKKYKKIIRRKFFKDNKNSIKTFGKH